MFTREPFVLVDIGHVETRVLAGSRKELVLARTIDYGGDDFLKALTGGGAGMDRDAAISLIDSERPRDARRGPHLAHPIWRANCAAPSGSSRASARRRLAGCTSPGGLVRSLMPLQILSDELEIACVTWDPFQTCQIELPKGKLAVFETERTHLNVACGAALDLLLDPKDGDAD